MIVRGAAAAAAVLLVVALLVRAAVTAPRQIPLNFNEGWNAYHAADLRAGRPLYPPTGYFINNYPPLSFIAVALATPIAGGDALIAGRLVALASFVVWIVALGAIARALGTSVADAALGAALVAGMMLVRTDYYVGVSEPQILGHAVQAVALWLAIRRTPVAGGLAGALFAISLFVKHNLIPLPLATLAWLWWAERSVASRALQAFAVTVLTIGAATFGAYGQPFVDQVFASRAYFPQKAVAMTIEWLPFWLIPIAVTTWLVASRSRRETRVMLVTGYAVAATALGVASFGGDGVYWNATFDAQWALGLAVAIALSTLRADGQRTTVAVACLAPLMLALGSVADRHWLSPRFYLDPRWSEADSAAREIAFLRRHDGPALCENLALCYWAGKAPEVDFFDFQQRVRHDRARADALAARIEGSEFSVVLLDGPTPRRDVGPRVREALARSYRMDHESQWGAFFVRR